VKILLIFLEFIYVKNIAIKPELLYYIDNLEGLMKKENKTTDGIIKTDIEKAQKRSTAFHFPRTFKEKVLALFTAISLTLSATFCLAACNFINQTTSVDPDKPNPIQPVDPEKPGPEKPDDPTTPVDPEEPDDPTKPVAPEKPDPEKPDPEKPDPENTDPEKTDPDKPDPDKPDPENPDPENPDDPIKTELTEAERISKIITALEANVQRSIGKTAQIQNYIALDFKEEDGQYNSYTLVRYIKANNDGISLVKIPMASELNDENLINNTYTPTSTIAGTNILNIPCVSSDERTKEALAKLKADSVLNYDKNITPDLIASAKGSSGVDTELKCGATFISLYRIDKNKIIYCNTRVKSDGATMDFYGDYLLNGILGTSYRVNDSFEYSFSEKAIYNYQGLEKESTDKKVSTSYNFTVDNQTSQYIRNGRYFYAATR